MTFASGWVATSGVAAGASPAGSGGSLVSIARHARRVVVLAVDDEERAMPARPREEVPHHLGELLEALDRRTPLRRRIHVERPIDHERAALDHRARDGAPVARVARAVAVVAHGEVRLRRHRERAELIAGA